MLERVRYRHSGPFANFIEGHAKTRPEVARRITKMLDAPMARLPVSGQVGAGEILPLFHVMSTMPDGDFQEAEPMARINGSPVSAGLLKYPRATPSPPAKSSPGVPTEAGLPAASST